MDDDPFFLPVDFLFAKRYSVSEESAYFLAYLLAAARGGHLCVCRVGEKWLPEAPEEEKLTKGAELLPPFPDVVRAENRWYLRRNFELERRFLSAARRLLAMVPTIPIPPLEGTDLLPKQQEVICHASAEALTLVTGGPGTGKSFTASRLISHFAPHLTHEIVVAAPTGKAAANLKERVGSSARVMTLHSLLAQGEILPSDLIVVDEGSMIDATRMTRLFEAIKEGGRLVLFGDPDQLPPVESGHLFADLINRNPEHVVALSTVLRTSESSILSLAAAVREGRVIPVEPLPAPELLIRDLPSLGCLLSPLRRGPYGVDTLNAMAFKRYGKGAIPICITQNDRRLELVNGEIGSLIGEEAHFLGRAPIARALLPPYEHAYALSVHKSQGSEFDEVTVLLPEGSERFGPEMLYTAITRAKKRVRVLGTEKVVEKMMKRKTPRQSGVGS